MYDWVEYLFSLHWKFYLLIIVRKINLICLHQIKYLVKHEVDS